MPTLFGCEIRRRDFILKSNECIRGDFGVARKTNNPTQIDTRNPRVTLIICQSNMYFEQQNSFSRVANFTIAIK